MSSEQCGGCSLHLKFCTALSEPATLFHHSVKIVVGIVYKKRSIHATLYAMPQPPMQKTSSYATVVTSTFFHSSEFNYALIELCDNHRSTKAIYFISAHTIARPR